MLQREVAERIAAPPGAHELPVGVRPVPRRRARRLRRARARVRARAGGRVGGPRRRDVRPRRLDAGRRGSALAAGPGRLPRAAQDAPQRAAATAAAGRAPSASKRRLPPAGIAPDRRPQTLSVDEWLALHAALGPIERRGRRMSPQARPMAKINLTLEVVGRRPDGFHELRSVFLRVALADRLTVAAAGPATRTSWQSPACPAARSRATSCCKPSTCCVKR